MKKHVDVRELSEEEKAEAFEVVGKDLAKLERQYGEAIVRWVAKRRHEQRAERKRLAEEKKQLEKRLAEIGG